MSGFFTEEEAGGKWCPMVRTSIAVGPAGDVHESVTKFEGASPFGCIGSRCMMWRRPGVTRDKATGEVFSTGSQMMEAIRAGAEIETSWADYGYCGLAGRPV